MSVCAALLCLESVPDYRTALGLCRVHSKQFLRSNWARRYRGVQEKTLDEWRSAYRPKWMKQTAEERKHRNSVQTRSWYWRAPAWARAVRSRYYERNRELEVGRARTYRDCNREKVRIWNGVRHRRVRAAAGGCTKQQWLWRVEFHGWRCLYCAAPLISTTLTMDHRIPIARGGSNWPANLVPACRSCNSRKGARSWLQT